MNALSLHISKTIGLLLVAVYTFWGLSAQASCSFIKNIDARALCRAKAKNSSSQCSFIKNSDQRAYCRASVDKKRAVSVALLETVTYVIVVGLKQEVEEAVVNVV